MKLWISLNADEAHLVDDGGGILVQLSARSTSPLSSVHTLLFRHHYCPRPDGASWGVWVS
jgi:hypothetical protein